MSATARPSRSEAQRRTKALLRAVIPVDAGGPGSERVADQYGCAASAVREWLNDEAPKNAPLAVLLAVDGATFNALVLELEALREELYGAAPAPATAESAALVAVGTSAAVTGAVSAAMADGRIDEHEAAALRPLVRRDSAANTRLLGRLGGDR